MSRSLYASVRPSVTSRYRIRPMPRWDKDSAFSPNDSVGSLVSCDKISYCWVRGFLWTVMLKGGSPLKTLFYQIGLSSVKTVAGRHRHAVYHNKYQWWAFRSIIINYLKRLWNPKIVIFVIFCESKPQHTF